MATNDTSPQKGTDRGTADPQQINTEPRWEAEWANEQRRRDKGTHKVSDFNLQKRKSRYLAQKRNIDRQEAARKLNRGEIELPEEVVL